MSSVERLAEAHHYAELLYHGQCGSPDESWDDHIEGHRPCFSEDQSEDTAELIAALDLGLAFAEAQRALPEGAEIGDLSKMFYDSDCGVSSWRPEWSVSAGRHRLDNNGDGDYEAVAYATGPTPQAALLSLAAKLKDAAP